MSENTIEIVESDIIPFHEIRPVVQEVDPIALVTASAGVIATIVFFFLYPAMFPSSGNQSYSTGDSFEYIEARLLKQGEIREEKEMPDRIVPPLPTKPEEILPLDKKEEKPETVKEDKKEEQPEAVDDDMLRQVFEKARAFAEIQDDFVPEGHPDGVPEGDVTDPALASLGATYGRRITKYIQDRWIVPTLISDAERNRLQVRVNIRFDSNMTIVDYKILTKSGNRLFDDSVVNAIEQVRKEVRHLPEPPNDIASRVYGGGLTITLFGADAPVN